VVVENSEKIAKTDPAPDARGSDSVTVEKDQAPPDNKITTATRSQRIKRAASPSINHRLAQDRHQQARELRAEGEAAKEQLMLALSIASTALNDAQKAVHDDGLKP